MARCRFAVAVPNFGPFANPAAIVSLAQLAEEAGWDGCFLWDHRLWTWPEPTNVIEPWPVLGAIAQTTTRLTIGTMVTPVARRRPWQLAREVITLDHLSRGRVMLGVGLGSPDEDFAPFWPHPSRARAPLPRELEAAEHRERWRRFHDGLQLLDQLLRGATVDRDDVLFTARNVTLRPRPYRNRTIPILVGGRATTMRALHLAAEHAGGVPIAFDRESPGQPSLQQVRTYATTIRQAAAPRTPLVAIWAHTDGRPRAAADIKPYTDAGVDWWIETVPGGEETDDPRNTIAFLRQRITVGPAVN
jgi:alkanesulfonate monooxygenase SsuD/methylene tetrahydromethanopterin reductase-like flavin-dependent oxidoreductase (luciferase family)